MTEVLEARHLPRGIVHIMIKLVQIVNNRCFWESHLHTPCFERRQHAGVSPSKGACFIKHKHSILIDMRAQLISGSLFAQRLYIGLAMLTLVLSTFLFPLQVAADLNDGLVGHWQLDENTGTSAADSSGSNNNGVVVGSPSWAPGVSGSALHFDGTGTVGTASNTINAGNNPSLNGIIDYTLSFWVKFDPGYVGNGGSYANLVGKTEGYSFSFMMYVNSSGTLRAHHTQSNGVYAVTDSYAPVSTGEWIQVAQVADGSHIRLYVNGVEAANPAPYDGTALSMPTANTYIGQDTRENTLKGTIDEVRIYNRGIDEEEAETIGEQFEPVDVTTSFLPDGTIGVPYSHNLAATGGLPPYTWSITSGVLPSGLSLNSTTGEISGNADTEATYNFTVRATEDEGDYAEKALSIKIVVPAILTYDIPDGTLGEVYTQTLVAGGGTGPYTWSLDSGTLPAGLTFNTSTGEISGTPTADGDHTFTVSVEDSMGGTDDQELEISIDTPAGYDGDGDGIADNIEDAAPNGGDANNDGTDDSEQESVSSFVNPVTSKYVVVEADGACTITAASNAAESANTVSDSGFNYPAGLMNFTADCGTPGYTTEVELYYFGTLNENFVLRKHNPNTKAYFNVSGANISQVTIASQTATKAIYQVTDGGVLDTDGTTNGTIVDPAGLALSAVGAPNTGLGGRQNN